MIERNIFPEEVEEFRSCDKDGSCPSQCNFQDCLYNCSDIELNKKYRKKDGSYKRPEKLNDSFFNKSIMVDEIQFAKNIIKILFRTRMTYTLENIVLKVKDEYPGFKKEFFEPYFVYKALDDFIPNNDNKKNNFKDPLIDMQDRSGYLIHRKNMYIFQPSGLSETVSIKHRMAMHMPKTRHITLETYLNFKSSDMMKSYMNKDFIYRYNDKYYADRLENDVIGIITKTSTQDVFNIRFARDRNVKKKRQKGLATDMGASCTSKSLEDLHEICKQLEITKLTTGQLRSKNKLCELIQTKLFDLEKNQTGTKLTYLKVPINHLIFPFPINTEDRFEYIKDQLEHMFYDRSDVSISVNDKKNAFKVLCESGNFLSDDMRLLEDLKARKEKGYFIVEI